MINENTALRTYLKTLDRGWKLILGTPGNGKDLITVIPGEMQSFTENFSDDGKSAVLTWQGHCNLGKNFTVTAHWREMEDGLLAGYVNWTAPQCSDLIEEVRFPVAELPFDEDSRIFWPHLTGFMHDGGKYPPGKPFGVEMSAMYFTCITHPQRGCFYMDCRDEDNYLKFLWGTRSEDCTRFTVESSWLVPLEDKPSAGELPYECCVKSCSGGWYQAARIYREWALTLPCWQNAPKSNPLRKLGLWLWNRGSSTEVLPVAEKLRLALGDVPIALDWYWWHHNPYDTDYPDFWPPREGEENFKATAARLKDLGIYTQVYINGECQDHDSYVWKDGGDHDAIITRNGSVMETAYNQYNMHRLANMCGEADAFQDKLSALVKTLRESGMSGQYMDMIGCAIFQPCYNPAHSHKPGGGHYMSDGYRKLAKRITGENPDFPLTTEGTSQVFLDVFHGAIINAEASFEHFGGIGEPVPAFQAVFHGRFAVFGSYAHPDGIPPWDPLWPSEDKWGEEKPWHILYPDQFFVEVSRSVIWGAQPMVCQLRDNVLENPDFAETRNFILETAKFYYSHRDFLFDGEMLSPDGFHCAKKQVDFFNRMIFTKMKDAKVISKEMPCILHGHWKAPDGRRALIMVNYTQDSQDWDFQGLSGNIPPRSYQFVELH